MNEQTYYTPEQTLRRVAEHLARQFAHAHHKHLGFCVYRGANGTACAVGCLLSDELAAVADALPSPRVDDIFNKYKVKDTEASYCGDEFEALCAELSRHAEGLLTDLQGLHDGYEPEDWAERGALLCRRYKVDPEVWLAPFREAGR